MRVVTTVHKAGFEQYGHRWVEGTLMWPTKADFIMYTEGDFDPPTVELRRVEDLPRLEAFKKAHKHYKSISWQWDVVRFANKVYAAYDAFYDYDGLGVWLDCDAVTYKPLPEGYVESLLPEGAYMGLFKRIGYHTETGFWLVDCRHEKHKMFFNDWLAMYETGKFKQLHEWHDCATLDYTVRKYESAGWIQTVSLSQGFEKDMHPMAKADIGKYIDHTKGARKAQGFSPENEHRAAA